MAENENGEVVDGQGTPPVDAGEGVVDPSKAQPVTLEELQEQNRMSQQQIQKLSENNELLQQMVLNQQNNDRSPDPYEEEDEFFDPTETKALDKRISQKVTPIIDAVSQQILESQENAMRQTHPDYDEVIKFTQDRMRTDPDFYKIIRGSKNPAEAAYTYGQTNPSISQKKEEAMRKSILEEMRTGSQNPQTLGSGGQPTVPDNSDIEAKINAESPEAFQARLNAIRNG